MPETKPPAKASLNQCQLKVPPPEHTSSRELRKEKAHIPRTVRIYNLLLLNRPDRILPQLLLALHSHDRLLRALRDDDDPLPLLVNLRQLGHRPCNLLNVLLLGLETVAARPRTSLRLVHHDVVPVRGGLVELVLEELGDEGGGDAKAKNLVVRGRVLRQSHDGGHAHRQVVSADVVDARLLD